MRRATGVLVAVACASCGPQHYLRGRVVDCQTSSAVEGADVQLASQARDVVWPAEQTGTDGKFEFSRTNATNATPLTLTVAKKGYQSAQKIYSVSPSAGEDVCLRPTLR
jgi:hypothetical protein